jgi:RNA-directed DNA polymerase
MPRQLLYAKLCSKGRLFYAWRVVQRNGQQSQSDETRREVEDFEKSAEAGIKNLLRDLKTRSFKFPAAHGIPVQKKATKKKRPIVRAPVRSRIVQRAILDVLQSVPAIRKVLRAGFNYGGISDGGVPHAIAHAHKTSQTHPYVIRTDIKGFFDNVPRDHAIKPITDVISGDQAFLELFRQAVIIELDNLTSLSEEERKLFPLSDLGVAQGSALSPLICNLYLHEFDNALNKRKIVCIRYIDDFILLAPNRQRARAALASALEMLKDLGLDAYDPATDKKKAEEGEVKQGFGFLGCKIFPGQVIPDADSRARLVEKVRRIFSDGLKLARQPATALKHGATFAESILKVSNTVRGWGNTYFFCNDERIFRQLDQQIDQLVENFMRSHNARTASLPDSERRLSLGVRLLADRKRDYGFLKSSVGRTRRHAKGGGTLVPT